MNDVLGARGIKNEIFLLFHVIQAMEKMFNMSNGAKKNRYQFSHHHHLHYQRVITHPPIINMQGKAHRIFLDDILNTQSLEIMESHKKIIFMKPTSRFYIRKYYKI